MINSKQIRAARALLDWSTAELAKQADLTVNGINKIERGHVQAQRGTLETLQGIFEAEGIEFLDFDGVRRRPEELEVLSGEEGIRRFLNQVYSYAQTSGGIIRQNGIEDEIFFKGAAGPTKEHCDKMIALKAARKNVFVRVLVPVGAFDFKCPEYAEYKWFPKNAPMPVPYYIFGNTVGIFAVDKDQQAKIYQISSPAIASAYIKQFDSAWEMAAEPQIVFAPKRKFV